MLDRGRERRRSTAVVRLQMVQRLEHLSFGGGDSIIGGVKNGVPRGLGGEKPGVSVAGEVGQKHRKT